MRLHTELKTAFALLSLCLSPAALAAAPPVIVTGKPVQFFSLSACTLPDFTSYVCKRNVRHSIPMTLYSSPRASIPMPPPFVPDSVILECAQPSDGTSPRLFINTSNVSCEILQCAESSETLCGYKLTVPAGAYLGDAVDIPVPEALFADKSIPHNISFREQCVYRGGKAVYQLESSSQVSCNLFPCPDASLTLCHAPISVKGGAKLGEVLTVSMPAPFAPDTFAVQCLGDGHSPPAYKIIDAAGVSCAIK